MRKTTFRIRRHMIGFLHRCCKWTMQIKGQIYDPSLSSATRPLVRSLYQVWLEISEIYGDFHFQLFPLDMPGKDKLALMMMLTLLALGWRYWLKQKQKP